MRIYFKNRRDLNALNCFGRGLGGQEKARLLVDNPDLQRRERPQKAMVWKGCAVLLT